LDFIPVAIVGSDGLKALANAPVSLTAKGMVPLSTPMRRLIGGLLVNFFRHIVLSLSMWLLGSTNFTRIRLLLLVCASFMMLNKFSSVSTLLVRGA
jgi:hypothetical protein